MRPPNRNRRLLAITICAAAVVVGVWMLLSVLNENTQFFYDPSEIVSDSFVPKSETYRVGGLVMDGTVVSGEGLVTEFVIQNFENAGEERVVVSYDGILPNLFREGQGVVMTGRLDGDDVFQATELLAKHDENYQPKTSSSYK